MRFQQYLQLLAALQNFLNWPCVMLIVLVVFCGPIRTILKSLAELISNIKELRFKDLLLLLQSNEIPVEIKKIIVTNYFDPMRNHVKESLELVDQVVECLRSHRISVMDNLCVGPPFNKTLQNLIQIFRVLYNKLELFEENTEIYNKSKLIYAMVQELETTRKQSMLSQSVPSINVLAQLDQDWKAKDPCNFDEIRQIKSLLKSIWMSKD